MFYHLQREGKFDQNRSRFYAAELLCALEHLHSFNVIYRDLKPENILCFNDGLRLAITDFGLATTDRVSTEFRTGSVYHMSPGTSRNSVSSPSSI